MAWTIDTSHTQLEFSAKHMMISTVRGRFTKFSGTVVIDAEHPEKSTAEGAVEIASIETHDTSRDAHLRSADFFDAEKFPQMTFRSTRIFVVPDGEYRVTGDLTIRDVTRPVTFTVTDTGSAKDPWGNQRRAFSATATINRKDWGLNWNVALEAGGFLVGEQVKLQIELELIQVAEPQPVA